MKHPVLHGAVAVAVAVLLLQTPVSASPASVDSRAPKPTITFQVEDVFRVDRQDSPSTVVVTGLSTKDRLRIDWGDGAVNASRGRCTVAKAEKSPTRCQITMRHQYMNAGAFTISVVGGRSRATKAVTVAPVPQRWTPPDGWVQPGGWATLMGATFTPCQNVGWYFDPTGLPPDRAGLKSDVAGALQMLATETGLSFREVGSAAEAVLVVNVKDLLGMGSGGFGFRPGSATVTIATDDPYTVDAYAGFGAVHFVYTIPEGTIDAMVPGRGWPLTRLLMGSLGFWMVEDDHQVMSYNYFPHFGFGAGDLDGLHTMYKNLGCPPIPD